MKNNLHLGAPEDIADQSSRLGKHLKDSTLMLILLFTTFLPWDYHWPINQVYIKHINKILK